MKVSEERKRKKGEISERKSLMREELTV